VVAAVAAGALLLVGILSALPFVSGQAPAPRAGGTPGVVTATPTARSTAGSTVTGGGIGRAVAFTGSAGSGTITVTRATWTDAGELPPPSGRRYLVVDVTVSCSRGEVAVSPVLLLAIAGAEEELPSFGAALERPLGGAFLAAGEKVTGQVGYALTPGRAQVVLLDESLHRLATVEVPAP
jgi:hypothetical protein